jgi:hypothetical protein
LILFFLESQASFADEYQEINNKDYWSIYWMAMRTMTRFNGWNGKMEYFLLFIPRVGIEHFGGSKWKTCYCILPG